MAAKPGDVLEPIGDIPAFSVSGLNFSSDVTIRGGRAVGTMAFSGCSNIVLEGMTLAGAGGAAAKYGVAFTQCRGVRVTSSNFTGHSHAVVFDRCDGFEVTGSDISAFTVDAIDMSRSRNGAIRGNRIHDATILSPFAHPDGVQCWSRATAPPSGNIVVEDNDIQGFVQGVFFGNHIRTYAAGTKLSDGTVLTVARDLNDGGFDNIVIRGNRICGAYSNGIGVSSVRGLVLRDNTVSTWPGATNQCVINVISSTNIDRCGNSVAGYTTPRGGVKKGRTEPACPK